MSKEARCPTLLVASLQTSLWGTMTLRDFLGLFGVVTTLFAATACSADSGATSGRCGSFNACGGDLAGTWTVVSSCVEGNLTAAANLNPNADFPPLCHGVYKAVVANVTGSVSFDPATSSATNNTITTADSDIVIEAPCATALGVPTLDAGSCAAISQVLIQKIFHDTAACQLEGATCHCTAKNTYVKNETIAYAVKGNSLTYTGETDVMDYCVQGTTLHSRQFETQLLSTVFFTATRAN